MLETVRLLIRVLCWVWSMPVTVFGVPFLLYYWPKSISWSSGAFDVVVTRRLMFGFNAQTIGLFVFYKDDRSARDPVIRRHERVHLLHTLIGGVFHPIGYGLYSLWMFLTGKHWYWDNWFERRAYANSDKPIHWLLR
jgi:hypothetical protein